MQATESLIVDEIRRVVEHELTLSKSIQLSDHLIDDLGLDSITLTTLAIELEDRFKIIISNEDAAQLQTVQDLVRYVALQTAVIP